MVVGSGDLLGLFFIRVPMMLGNASSDEEQDYAENAHRRQHARTGNECFSAAQIQTARAHQRKRNRRRCWDGTDEQHESGRIHQAVPPRNEPAVILSFGCHPIHFSPNVKDEPRVEPARRVLPDDLGSAVSFSMLIP